MLSGPGSDEAEGGRQWQEGNVYTEANGVLVPLIAVNTILIAYELVLG